MARRRPAGRLEQLLSGATRVFIAKGYRRTQMADVAREMGVSPGALYGYVESKEALFLLLIDRAFTERPADAPPLPVRTPAPGATLARLRDRLALETKLPRLSAATAHARVADPRVELEEVLVELYDLIERTRAGTALIERSALDMPGLATVFYVEVRRDVLTRLTRYLEKRIRAGLLRRVPDAATVARLILETITWFARHRLRDADPATTDDATARATTIDFLLAGLIVPSGKRAAR